MAKWDAYKAARDSGKTIHEVIDAGIASRATAYRLEKRYASSDGVQEVESRPDGIRADGFDGAKKTTEKKTRSKSSIKNAPITEETAGLLLQGVSEVVAFLASEHELALTDEEVELLERPLTESLAIMPRSVGSAINKYAAPGLFFSQIVAIYGRKMQRIAMKRAGVVRRPIAQPQTGAPRAQTPPPRPPDLEPVIADPNLEAAIRAAAATVNIAATNGAAPKVDGTSGSGAPTVSTGVLEVEDRKTEFES